MAKEIIETWVCDVTGDPAFQEEFFAIGSDEYVIDLSENADKEFWEWARYYIKRARLRPRRSDTAKTKDKPGVQVHHGKARKWCQSVGIAVNAHGAVSQEALNAYVGAWLKGDVPEKFL